MATVSRRLVGLRLVLVSGDHPSSARAVAAQAGIKEFHGGIGPAGKAEIVQALRAAGSKVAMAGDGIHDAPALAAADVGIAMGTGSDAAIESAGVTLVKGDLRGIVKAIHLSRHTMQNIRQNLFFALIYNALGVPIAAGVLYPLSSHLLLNPMIAAAAMSLSSVSVVARSSLPMLNPSKHQRRRRKDRALFLPLALTNPLATICLLSASHCSKHASRISIRQNRK